MKVTRFIATVMFMMACTSCLADGKKKQPVDSILKEFHNADSDQVLVVAHRAAWRTAPENSIPAIKNAIKMGCDAVEIDTRKTKDGVWVLMHDGTVNRTTNGKGKVSSLTFKEIRKLRLKHKGKVTDVQVPTLEEALNAVKGKIMIDLDKAWVYPDLLKLLKKTETLKQAIFVSKASVKDTNNQLKKCGKLPKINYMPNLKKGGMEVIKDYQNNLLIKPTVLQLAFIKKDAPFASKELIKYCRKNGMRPWINTLWHSHCAGLHDGPSLKDPDKGWGVLINKGFNMIQTDSPAKLLEYLRKKGLHR